MELGGVKKFEIAHYAKFASENFIIFTKFMSNFVETYKSKGKIL